MRLHWIAIAATSVIFALTVFFVFRSPNRSQEVAQPSYRGLSREKCIEQKPETGMMPEYSCEKP
jgi:hypothetical protein